MTHALGDGRNQKLKTKIIEQHTFMSIHQLPELFSIIMQCWIVDKPRHIKNLLNEIKIRFEIMNEKPEKEVFALKINKTVESFLPYFIKNDLSNALEYAHLFKNHLS